MTELLIHPQTSRQIDAFLKRSSHALLIEGVKGSGRGVLAAHITAQLLGRTVAELVNYPYLLRIVSTDKTIPIAMVREMQQFMRLKTTGKGQIRRIVLIEDADGMTIEAQNAFLKLLEEPPTDTVLILTAIPNSALLPTIYSRLQRIRITNPTKDELIDYFKNQGMKSADIARAYYISEGSIGLMSALLQEADDNGVVKHINLAKEIMAEKPFARLVRVDTLAKDKEGLSDLLFSLQRVVHAVLVQASERGDPVRVKRAYVSLRRIIEAESALPRNPNPKLLLTDLFLNI